VGYGRWTRWGRGSCEGYSLEIGTIFRATVSRANYGANEPITWMGSINSKRERIYPDKDTAMRDIEHEIESEMRTVLDHWAIYQALKLLGSKAPKFRD
jgi:hypothetical protein